MCALVTGVQTCALPIYTAILRDGGDEAALYTLAVDLLIALHRRFQPEGGQVVPPYDDDRLLGEAALLVEWYLPALRGAPTPPALRQDYLDLWRAVLPLARAVPEPLVRDRDSVVEGKGVSVSVDLG